jgi:hypothetical protein
MVFARSPARCRIDSGMRYDNYDAYRRTVAASAFWRRLVWRTIEEGIRAIPERIRAQRTPLFSLTPPRPLARADVPLILVTRDSADLLPSFIRHYRGLGVTRFIVVDDQSSDGARDILTGHSDVDLWASTVRYRDAQLGLFWCERLARRYGQGRWYVNVDTDEFLVYDGMDRHQLPELFRWLERKRLRRLLAPMLDLYPPGPLSAAVLEPGLAPWEVATHFDAAGYAIDAGKRTTLLFGGPRVRLFGVRAQMAKFPVLYWDRTTFFCKGIHAPFPYIRNFGPIAGALLHFKYFADFRDRVEAAVMDKQHWRGGAEYQAYHERLREVPDLVMAGNVSRPYAGVRDLVTLGFVAPIDWTDDAPRATDRSRAARGEATSPGLPGRAEHAR